MEKRSVIVFILSFIVLATAGIVYLFIPKGANAPFLVPQPMPNAQIPKDWKTYENTKYHYSFRYPKEYKIWQFVGVGSFSEITNDADTVLVGKKIVNEILFNISGTNFPSLDEEAIKRQFVGVTPPEDIKIILTYIANQPAYRLAFKRDTEFIPSNFYFVRNLNGQIFQITIDLTNSVANQIFSSLKFTK